MVKAKKVLAALALAAWTVTPALAEEQFTPVDVMGVTCGGFMAMDTTDRNDVSFHVLKWIGNQDNAVAAQKLIGKYASASGATSPEDLTIEIEGHCKDATPDVGVIDRLIEHT